MLGDARDLHVQLMSWRIMHPNVCVYVLAAGVWTCMVVNAWDTSLGMWQCVE